MPVDLGKIILGGLLALGCCLCGMKQVVNNMDRPTFVDAEYWRDRQARQHGNMQNMRWIQPTVTHTHTARASSLGGAPRRMARSYNTSSRVRSAPRDYMPLISVQRRAMTVRSA